MEKFDVIIIGGGPAGLRCAEILQKSNKKILLLDKNKVLGDKPCGGGLTHLDEGLIISENKYLRFKKLDIFINDKNSQVRLVHPIRTINRKELASWQLQKLDRLKIEIHLAEPVTNINIQTNTVTTKKNEYQYKYLIGADGSYSLVRKKLGLTNRIFIGVNYVIPKKYDKMVFFINPQILKTGYGWIFPHTDYTSAGIYYDPNLVDRKQAIKYLDDFLQRQNIDLTNYKLEAAPINTKYLGLEFNDIYLAGDAAGMASASTGEGIAFALASGEDVAKKILNPHYFMRKTYSVIVYKKIQEFFLTLFNNLPLINVFLFKIFFKLMQKKWFQIFYGN